MIRAAIQRWQRFFLVFALPALILVGSRRSEASSPASGKLGGCQVFPSDNPWNQDISNSPVNPNSDNYINRIGRKTPLHPDFGSDPTYGIPFVAVKGTQRLVPITYDEYEDESDPGPFPIPLNAPVEAGDDAHVLTIDTDHCVLYELYHARQEGDGWTAGAGAKFDLRSNVLRPDDWTSADAAGLPIFPGLVRYDEATSGEINHALRFTVPKTQKAYIHPATHYASSLTDPNLPPMGLRFRLKARFDVSRFKGASLAVLKALKKYGMFIADNGSAWFISGQTESRWDDDDLEQLKTVTGDAFEVVQPVDLATPSR